MQKWWLPLCLLVPFALATSAQAQAELPEDVPTEMNEAQMALQVEILLEGTGAPLEVGEVANFHYTCSDLDGEVLSETEPNKPLRALHKEAGSRMIQGWTQGVSGIQVGERRRLIIPPSLAYGAQGAQPAIAPHTTLVFEIERVPLDS